MQPDQNNQQYNPTGQPTTTDATTPTVLGQAQMIDAQNPEAAAVVEQAWPAHKEPTVRAWRRYIIFGLAGLLVIAGILLLLRLNSKPVTSTKAGDFGVLDVPLERFAPEEEIEGEQILEVNGQLQVGSSIIISPSVQPSLPVIGQLYYDETTNQLAYYNGAGFVSVAGGSVVQNTFNTVSGGGGITSSGTANRLVKFTGATSLGNSVVSDQGTHIQVNGGVNVVPSVEAQTFTLWPDSPTPDNPSASDTEGPVELGTKFNTDVPGFINSIRFYRGTTSTGPYVVSLWTNSGVLLARKTATVSGFGWQEVVFDSPVAISSDTTYVASYHTQFGYAISEEYFGSGVHNGPLHALASGLDGFNGVFTYSATPTFPNEGFQSSNYWIDVSFTGSLLTLDSRYRVNGAQISSGDLSNNTDLAKRSSAQVFSGHNIFRNSSDSFAAFDIQKADTTQIFSVNTTDSIIYVGPNSGNSPGVLLVLGRRTSTGDPAGVDGAIYYSVDNQAFRCYRFGEWSDCGSIMPSSSYSAYEEFLGGNNTSFTSAMIGNLGWTAHAIGANGALSFNPGTPTPAADRPGVLALQTPAVINQGTTFTLGDSSGGSMLISTSNLVKTSVAVGAATDQVLRVGLHNQTTGTAQPTSGIWWEADPAANVNWRYCYGDGAAATCTASNVAIAANAWVRLEMRVRATGTGTSAATFYINNTNPLLLNNVTIDSTNRVSPAYSCFTTAASAQNCYWDYFQFRGTTSVLR